MLVAAGKRIAKGNVRVPLYLPTLLRVINMSGAYCGFVSRNGPFNWTHLLQSKANLINHAYAEQW